MKVLLAVFVFALELELTSTFLLLVYKKIDVYHKSTLCPTTLRIKQMIPVIETPNDRLPVGIESLTSYDEIG